MIMAKIHHFENFSIVRGDVTIRLNLDRFSDQYNRAQFELDSMVMTSMIPYMPFNSGMFIDQTRAKSAAMAGSGKVCGGISPYGRFLYEGKTMVDEVTGSPWARAGAKKVLVSQYSGKTNARENLTYSNGRQSHWFEAAEKADKQNWIKTTKEIAGGG